MSKYPTPWESLAWDEVRAADGDTVIEYDERWIIKIDLDELVARVNAGAEAIERLAFMTKVADEAIRMGHFALDFVVDNVDQAAGMEIDCYERHERDYYYPSLTAYLKEKDEA